MSREDKSTQTVSSTERAPASPDVESPRVEAVTSVGVVSGEVLVAGDQTEPEALVLGDASSGGVCSRFVGSSVEEALGFLQDLAEELSPIARVSSTGDE